MNKVGAIAVSVIAVLTVLDAKDDPIKIGTIAPEGSIYAKALYQMGDAWQKRTQGRVTYRVQVRGVNETEESMLLYMRPSARRLHAAQLSAITLGSIDEAFNVFGLPMFYESYAEADRVLDKLSPILEKKLEASGYRALNWAYAGWVHVFSSQPVRTVADLKKLKLYTSTGDDRMAKWYSANGFLAVPIDSTEIVTSLKTNMIQAVPAPPAIANLIGWYSSAPYMMDIGFAPLMGSTVMSLERWKSLSEGDQKIVLEEAKKVGDQLRKDIPGQDEQAIKVMSARGLKVIQVDRAEWRVMAEQLAEAMRKDGSVPVDVYEIAKRERDAARSGK